MNHDTAALVMNHLSVFDLVAWGSTCRLIRGYVYRFLRMRLQAYIPFEPDLLGLLCIYAEMRGEVGEPPVLIREQYGFTKTALARMVKRYGANYATPPKSVSLGSYCGFERYSLSHIKDQYNSNIHSANLRTVLRRRTKERAYRAKARNLKHKILHPSILALVHQSPCWIIILQSLRNRERPPNSQIRKVEQFGANIMVEAFMNSRFMRQQPFSDETRKSIRRNSVEPWFQKLVQDWIELDPKTYQSRSVVELMRVITAQRIPELQEWVNEAKVFLEYCCSCEQRWELAHLMRMAIQHIDMDEIVRKHHHFPPLNARTLSRFACLPHTNDGDDLVDVFMRSDPDDARMHGVNWKRLGDVLREHWECTAPLITLSKKDIDASVDVIQRNPALTIFASRVNVEQFPQCYLDEESLNFLLPPFIKADEHSFHPWVALKSISIIAKGLQEEPSVKTAQQLLLSREKRPMEPNHQPLAKRLRHSDELDSSPC